MIIRNQFMHVVVVVVVFLFSSSFVFILDWFGFYFVLYWIGICSTHVTNHQISMCFIVHCCRYFITFSFLFSCACHFSGTRTEVIGIVGFLSSDWIKRSADNRRHSHKSTWILQPTLEWLQTVSGLQKNFISCFFFFPSSRNLNQNLEKKKKTDKRMNWCKSVFYCVHAKMTLLTPSC